LTTIKAENLPLSRIYHWERELANETYLVQPMGGGVVRNFSWADAMGEARRVAAYLGSLDLPPGSSIGILSKNCAHWILSDFAIWMAGHVSVPIYPSLTAESMRQILEHSEARVLFVGKLDGWETTSMGVPQGVHCIGYPYPCTFNGLRWDDIVGCTQPLRESIHRMPEDLATIIYTSGTTGEPKGVMQTFGALGWCPEPALQLMSIGPADRMLSYLPLAHVAERAYGEMLSVRTGLTLYFSESLDTFTADLQRARPTVFLSVPRLWTKFQHAVTSKLTPGPIEPVLKPMILRQLGLDQVRLAASGAAALEPEIMQWYRDLGLELLEGYGMTEVCGLSHSCRPGQVRVGYVGTTTLGTECRFSEAGEILVRSPSSTIGYYKRPDLTAELFAEDGFIRTGDKGSMDDEGRLKVTGRVKEIFKTTKGKYVAPSRIENRLSVHPYVEACCVVGQGFPQPCSLVSLSEEGRRLVRSGRREALTKTLIEHLEQVNRTLDDHEKVDFIVVVDATWNEASGLVTPTFKIRRGPVEQRYGPCLSAWYGQDLPVIWEAVAAW